MTRWTTVTGTLATATAADTTCSTGSETVMVRAAPGMPGVCDDVDALDAFGAAWAVGSAGSLGVVVLPLAFAVLAVALATRGASAALVVDFVGLESLPRGPAISI